MTIAIPIIACRTNILRKKDTLPVGIKMTCTFAWKNKNLPLPVGRGILPVERKMYSFLLPKQVLLHLKKDGTLACGESCTACGEKNAFLPVERGVLCCLWK